MNRIQLLKQAEMQARSLRRSGFSDAMVCPEYCVAAIGPDGFWTYTISIYAGVSQRNAQAGDNT